MSRGNIELALINQVVGIGLSEPIAYPNINYTPTGVRFVDLTMLDIDGESLGKNPTASDERNGIFQISVYEVAGKALADMYATIESIMDSFRFGDTLTYGGVNVEILNTDQSAGRNANGWFIVDLSINFTSYTSR